MEGHFGERRSIGLEDALFLPFCLIFLLYGNKIVSFFSLEIGLLANSKTRGKLFTYTLQLFGFGDCGILQGFCSCIYSRHFATIYVCILECLGLFLVL